MSRSPGPQDKQVGEGACPDYHDPAFMSFHEEMPGGAWQGAHTPKGSTGDSGDGKVQQWEGKTPEMGSSVDGQHPKPTVQPP